MEIRARLAYSGSRRGLSYWRTSSGLEVDFILGDADIAIEVKSSEEPTANHTKGLRAWKEDNPRSRCILVCRASRPRRTDEGIDILPWRDFLDQLWEGGLDL